MTGPFPATRLRRTRATAWSRALHRETVLTPANLIWPLFVTEGAGVEDPIGSLPGVSRWSVDGIAARAKEAVSLGIPCIALFPNTPPGARSEGKGRACSSLARGTRCGWSGSAGTGWAKVMGRRAFNDARGRLAPPA